MLSFPCCSISHLKHLQKELEKMFLGEANPSCISEEYLHCEIKASHFYLILAVMYMNCTQCFGP